MRNMINGDLFSLFDPSFPPLPHVYFLYLVELPCVHDTDPFRVQQANNVAPAIGRYKLVIRGISHIPELLDYREPFLLHIYNPDPIPLHQPKYHQIIWSVQGTDSSGYKL